MLDGTITDLVTLLCFLCN